MSEKRTPFFEKHIYAGAKMVDFAGFKMPMFYKGIMPEHLKVRKSVGIFDLSHMGEFFVTGEGALSFISLMTTNNPESLEIGQCQYSAMCYDDGGIVDDLLVYRLGDQEYMLVVNASNIAKDWEWIEGHIPSDGVELIDRSDNIGLLAIQGPDAQQVFSKLTDFDLDSLPFYQNARAKIAGVDNILFSRTGYTGEDGFELYIPNEHCIPLWDKTIAAGEGFEIEPIGLGARDTLRLEMKYALYGNDIDATTNPWEAGLGWIVKLEKGNFIGRDALINAKTNGLTKRLICFKLIERGFPRKGYPILKDGTEVGVVTSGTFSPSLEAGIGLGYIRYGDHKTGAQIQVMIRNHPVNGIIEKPPLYKEGSHK